VTSADPLLLRFALGRSNDGSQFGMFLQVFTDGTVIDSEGVHRLRNGDLKQVIAAASSAELYRIKGHCGAPATDFIEYVHIVVFERRMGRLMAHSFSYSGNPQGCDHAIHRLHAALENLQVKLSGAPITSAPGGPTSTLPLGSAPIVAPASVRRGAPALPPVTGSYPTRQPSLPAAGPGWVPAASVIPLSPVDRSK
jgi:hypothetical protein